jgi:hypothetical protein
MSFFGADHKNEREQAETPVTSVNGRLETKPESFSLT